MSRASAFRQRDLEKALAAARKVGVEASAVVVNARSGEIRFELGGQSAAPAPTGADTPDAALARWQAEHGG